MAEKDKKEKTISLQQNHAVQQYVSN